MQKFMKLALSLGIVVPACLLGLSEKSHASVTKPKLLPTKKTQGDVKNDRNQVKIHLLEMIGPVSNKEIKQLAHTNIHANYTISHTNVHTDFKIDRNHTDQHSNTPSKHVNDHHNSKV